MLGTTRKPKRPTLVEEACTTLAEHIRSEFGPGASEDWLPAERELALRLGVSRTVIREATKRLELQGLLEIHHGKGLKVVNHLHKPFSQSLRLDIPDSADRLRQLNETRLVFEPETARLAALRAMPEDVAALQDIQERLRLADDVHAAADADVAFHHRLALASGNAIVAMLLRSLGELNRESRLRTISATGIARAHQHHASILAAVEAGDPDGASAQMRHHVEEAGRDLKYEAPIEAGTP